MNKINGKDNNYQEKTEDFIAAGFHQLDERLMSKKPPKIKWGIQYKGWPDSRKIKYLEKLSSSMNHAASLISDERDELNKLLLKKEEQLNSMKKALEQNNDMIQSQIMSMNTERQQYNKAAAANLAKIRSFENGNNG